MERIEYRNVHDKSSWERGPWDHEPDKIQWPDAATGLPCLIVRGPHGALCGYVGVPEGHKLFGKGYSEDRVFECGDGCSEDHHYDCTPEARLRAHGGVNFARLCIQTADEEKHICHRPASGEPDHVWWFGFDCAHAGDFSPSYSKMSLLGIPTGWGGVVEYRDVAYVERECEALADQLRSHGNN
jgi:hypothetical protein